MKTFIALTAAFLMGIACGPSQDAKEAAASGAYLAEHLRCVEEFDIRAEIDACRRAVRIRWGISDRPQDGGSHD